MTLSPSSQGFVRALKAASDPPQSGGPHKIEIARQAWDDATFYVPNKAEVIADWIFTKFLKDKATTDLKMNPVLDTRLWTLLSDVISTPRLLPAVANSHPVKTWLVTLLNRISIAPITISFLNALATLKSEYREKLTVVVHRCLSVIWPLAVHKLNPDLLLDCFGAFHGVFKQCEMDENLAHIGLLITCSFRTSLGNMSNKKKLYITFIQNHLKNWMEYVLVKPSRSVYGTLVESSFAAGVECMFSLDILRQTNDLKSESTLFDAFRNIGETFNSGLVLAVLPGIFASFLQCIKKYRSSLFSHGSNQPGTATDGFRAVGMRFFVSSQSLLREAGSNEQTWPTRIALLALVDKENLFSRQPDGQLVLKEQMELAISLLSCGSNVRQNQKTLLAVEYLSVLTRIDYDLIAPAVPRILPPLLLVSEPHKSIFEFLDLLLDYHTKTRTMHTYIINLFAALSSDHLSALSEGSRQVYQFSSVGPLLHPIHLDRLGKCIQGFLTSNQTVATVHRVLQWLKEGWEQYHVAEAQSLTDNGAQSSPKGRKVGTKAEGTWDPEFLAVTFSLSTRIVSVILSSLPVQAVPGTKREEIQSLLEGARRTTLHLSLTKTLEVIQKQNCIDVWASQIVTAATLRLQDILNATRHVIIPRHHDSQLSVRMMHIAEDDRILPELSLAIFCSLLSSSAAGGLSDPQAVLLHVLGFLDRNLKVTDASWSGLSYYRLTVGEGKPEYASALLHLVIDKWLPTFDAFASEPQLEKLVRLICEVQFCDRITSPPDSQLGENSLFIHAMRSAQFWELPKLRDALLAFINMETSTVDGMDLPSNSQRTPFQIDQVRRAIPAFEVLLFFPIEYISRTIRTDLVKRALTADMLISNLTIDKNNSARYICRSLTIIRVLVRRIFVSLGSIDQSMRSVCQFLEHVLKTSQPLLQPTEELRSATLDLVELHLSSLFKSSENSTTRVILEVMHSFSECNMLKPSSINSSQSDIPSLSFTRMIDLLTTDFSPSNFVEEVQVVMRSLHDHLLSTLLPLISAAVGDQTTTDIIIGQSGLFTSWCYTLSFGRWLGLKPTIPRLGQRLASKIVAASAISSSCHDICVTTLAILLQELYYCPHPDRFSHMDVTEAVFITFSRTIGSNGRTQMDHHVSKASRGLSVSDFSHILEFTSESLSGLDDSSRDLTYLLHFSVLLLHDHPSSTLKHIQAFTTQCINLFANRPVFTLGSLPLRLQVLSFVKQHCCDRPAALRLVDLGSVWSLLSKLLARSDAHEKTTSKIVFHEIIVIINALIRLRRDLVSLTLPHLVMVLRQLILSLRSPRPHLGSKQSTFVADTLPQWVNVKEPLGAEEGKALARLLEMLTTKSIVRIHTAENQKAESLAKPFSKHAAYVLKAYIDALNDPLCILPSELKKEIQPGLFSLCSMLTDHSRDAMMVSALDAGGKVTMKTLWKDYEKQKYIGKG